MKQLLLKLKAKVLEQTTPEQFVKYVATGFISFASQIFILYLCKDVFGLWYIYANSIAMGIVFWLNFLTNRIWTFQSKMNFGKQLFRYGSLFIFNFIISNFVMFIMTDFLMVYYLVSKVSAAVFAVTWNYILYKKVIYR